MSNTRAMQWKENSEEYDSKKSDIDRLKTWLEKEVAAALRHSKKVHDMGNASDFFQELVEDVSVMLNFYQLTDGTIKVLLSISPGTTDNRFTLYEVRVLHRNLDVTIKLAEECCLKYGVADHFEQAKFRFKFQ